MVEWKDSAGRTLLGRSTDRPGPLQGITVTMVVVVTMLTIIGMIMIMVTEMTFAPDISQTGRQRRGWRLASICLGEKE